MGEISSGPFAELRGAGRTWLQSMIRPEPLVDVGSAWKRAFMRFEEACEVKAPAQDSCQSVLDETSRVAVYQGFPVATGFQAIHSKFERALFLIFDGQT